MHSKKWVKTLVSGWHFTLQLFDALVFFFSACVITKQKLIHLTTIATSNDRTYLGLEECNFLTDGVNLTIDKQIEKSL